MLTIRIYDTLRTTASDGVRLGNKARLTGADSIACSQEKKIEASCYINGRLTSRIDIALSPGSTGIRLAGVGLGGASVGSADVSHAAVRVNHTLRLTTGDSVRCGGEARDTATLGVTIPVKIMLEP